MKIIKWEEIVQCGMGSLFLRDEMNLEILIQAWFNEWDWDFFFGLNEFEWYFISFIISFKSVFTFKMIITFNLWEFRRFHILNGIKQYFYVANDT